MVFAGGGGKRAYQIGVWKALEEIGIAQRVEAVAGTSVGALNAALFAQGDYGLAEFTWLGITKTDVLNLPKGNVFEHLEHIGVNVLIKRWDRALAYLHRSGIFSREGLTRVIDKTLCTHLHDRNIKAGAGKSGEALSMELALLLARFAQAGIDVDTLALQLQRDGAQAFVKSWKELLERIAGKSAALAGAGKEHA